jgi:hypothetical protein
MLEMINLKETVVSMGRVRVRVRISMGYFIISYNALFADRGLL